MRLARTTLQQARARGGRRRRRKVGGDSREPSTGPVLHPRAGSRKTGDKKHGGGTARKPAGEGSSECARAEACEDAERAADALCFPALATVWRWRGRRARRGGTFSSPLPFTQAHTRTPAAAYCVLARQHGRLQTAWLHHSTRHSVVRALVWISPPSLSAEMTASLEIY